MSRTNSFSSSVSLPIGTKIIESDVDNNETKKPISRSKSKSKYSISESKKNDSNSKPRSFLDNIKQQSLPSWRPTFSANKVSPFLFILGIIFIPIGAGIWIFSNNVQEINLTYTDCLNTLRPIDDPDKGSDYNKSCSEVIDSPETALIKSCKCRIKFNITSDLNGTIYMYYALTNFYQNHRRYISSRDDKQLRGNPGTAEDPKKPSSECDPYDYYEEKDDDDDDDNNDDDNKEGKAKRKKARIYYPCGAIANSMFSDEIKLFYNKPPDSDNDESHIIPVPLNRTGISWSSDREYKFINPYWFDNFSTDPKLQYTFVKPHFWKKQLWELDPDNPENNGVQNEDFIVWMRAAALPNFRKLYRIINKYDETRPEFAHGLPAGEYVVEIDYNFAVKSFKGSKTIIFSTTSILGASNPFLGITYVIVGTLCVILGLFTLIVHVTARKKMNPKVVHVD